MAESLAGKMVFALIFLPLFSFPAKLAALKAPVSKLEGRFGGFFISLHWTKPVHRPGVKFLDGQWDFFFLQKPTQNSFSTKQSSFYSLCCTETLSVYICPIPQVKITLTTLTTFFFLLFLICLFIPIYFWHSLTKAESSVKLSGSDCFSASVQAIPS